MRATENHPRLSAEEVDQYNDQGYYIFPEAVFPDEKFRDLKAHFEAKLAEWPSDQRPEGMDVPHFTDPKLFEWLLADEVLDIVEPILGPDIALFSSHFICKPKGDGRKVPWHEDSAYWRKMLDPMEVVTLWLAIDPSLEENGCMKVIPYTHRMGSKGFSDYDPVDTNLNVFPSEITRKQRDESKAVSCILEANHASLHNGRLMHGSEANRSDLRRCGYTMRFVRSSTVLSDKACEYHQMYMARGKDLSGKPEQYGDSGVSYEDLLGHRLKIGKKGH
ncbi:MAG: phytanoyl-CoA dioxygenase family protein [Verrucomicrobiota bacterium]